MRRAANPTPSIPLARNPAAEAARRSSRSYDTLVARPVEGADFVPSLATEVPTQENGLVSEDGLTYTFPIREGVTFHDGTELTADDVKYSWDRVIEMDLAEGGVLAVHRHRRGDTKVVDDFTFEVTLKEPAGWFLAGVVYTPTAAIVSQDAVEANGGVVAGEPNEYMDTHMVGTGPFQFVELGPRRRVCRSRPSTTTGASRWPSMPAGRSSPTTASGCSGMEAGDYDIIEPTPQFVSQLEGNEDICIEEAGFLLEPLHLSFNLNIPEDKLPPEDTIPSDFFHDVRVRQAFNYAFDYEAYIAAGLEGNGATGTYLPPDMLGSDPERAEVQPGSRPRQSASSARAAGGIEGFTVSVLVESNNPTFEAVGLILKDSLERLNDELPGEHPDRAGGSIRRGARHRARSSTRCGSRTRTCSRIRTR